MWLWYIPLILWQSCFPFSTYYILLPTISTTNTDMYDDDNDNDNDNDNGGGDDDDDDDGDDTWLLYDSLILV